VVYDVKKKSPARAFSAPGAICIFSDILYSQMMDPSWQPIAVKSADDRMLAESVVVTRLESAVNWARKYSLFPYPFATACCAMEYMSLSMSPYDIDRFGALLPRFSPRQADLLMVIGTVNQKLAPVLKRVYEQMSEPKWVMAFGACAASGGFYDNYATVQGIDRIVPVDVYVPGCPPRPETVLDGLMELQGRIAGLK
jgi:NADH-quinone oxidoreductase subunit B